MAASYIPYLNLQYFFCIISALFGSRCSTAVGAVHVDGSGVVSALNTATSTLASTTAQLSQGGFWSWLWPFGSLSFSNTTVVDATTGAVTTQISFWASALHLLPEPVQQVLVAAGVGLSILWTAFSWASYSISGILFMAILSSVLGLVYIRMKEWSQYGTLPPAEASKSYGWSRWQDLLNETMTTDPKKWKLAIVAADGMLGELLTHLGYHGETTGDQMRSLPDDAFVTVPAAWEAHRIKNFVAARNSNYILTQREAFRIMKLYEQVFEEFDFI